MVAYDLISGANEALVLRVAVPGLHKSDLEVNFSGDLLTVKQVVNTKKPVEYLRKGIKEVYGEWIVDSDLKIDMVSLENGILEVLLSKKIPVPPKGTRLEIQ